MGKSKSDMAIPGLAAWRTATVIALLALIQGCVNSPPAQPADRPDYVRLATLQLPTPGGRRPGEKLGRQHLIAGNYAESVRFLTLALESEPAIAEAERAYVLRYRALALAGAGQESAALWDINEAVSIWRTLYGYANEGYLDSRGWVNLTAGKPQQVIDDLRALGLPEPDDAQPGKRGNPLRHHMRGHAYRELGRLDLAEKDFGKAMESAPDTLVYVSAWVMVVREEFAASGGNPANGFALGQRLRKRTKKLENAPRIFHTMALLDVYASRPEPAVIMMKMSIQTGGPERLVKYQTRLKREGYFDNPINGDVETLEETVKSLRRCIKAGCNLLPPL